MPELVLRYRTPHGWCSGRFEFSHGLLAFGIERLSAVAEGLVEGSQKAILEAKVLLDGREVHHVATEVQNRI